MTVSIRCRLVAVLALGSLFVASQVSALTDEERRCQKTLAKAAQKFYTNVHKSRAACESAVANGEVCDQAGLASRLSRAEAKLIRSATKRCTSSELSGIGFPGQCEDLDGPPFTPADLTTCLRDTHNAQADRAVRIEFPGAPGALSPSESDCVDTIGRHGRRFVRDHSSPRSKCRDAQIRGKVAPGLDCNQQAQPDGPGVGDPKTDKRLSKSVSKLGKRLGVGCGGVVLENLGFPGRCVDSGGSPFSVEDLVDCVGESHAVIARELIDVEFALNNPVATTTTTTSTTSTTTTTIPSFADLADSVSPGGDADGDGFSNAAELAACSNPADAASDPSNDDTLCNNNTIFSDTLGPAWGNTNTLAEPSYAAALAASEAQIASECSAYCASRPDMGSPQACVGAWPWSGVPEHTFYDEGQTVEVTFPDESGNILHGTMFLPPDVTCIPDDEPTCDGVTDPVVCTDSGGKTYPAVVICDGFTGTQRMYYWAGHRLAAQGYITMTFDVSGQGRSTGQFPNGDAALSPGGGGFSRDIGAAMNFMVSASNPVLNLIEIDPLLIENQGLGDDHLEQYNLGLAGHSAGASATITYQQSVETATYPVRARAGVGWSHFDHALTIGNIPLQLHSGDEDSGFIQPPGSGTQGPAMERRFDRLSGDQDLNPVTPDAFVGRDRQIIMIEDATHLGYSQGAWFYYPTWQEEVQYHYTLAWFDKYQKNDVARTMSDVVGNVIQSIDEFNDYAVCSPPQANCYTATERLKMSHVHLSDIWCSRYDIAGDFNGSMKGGSCRVQ